MLKKIENVFENHVLVKGEILTFLETRGFIYRNSQIYGGVASSWDYGHLGVEIKRNIKKIWWDIFVLKSEYNIGYDGNILLNKRVWDASGHEKFFVNILKDCRLCKKRFEESYSFCPGCGSNVTHHTPPRKFELMFRVNDKYKSYLRPETAQNIIVNFENIQRASRRSLPFGVAQIGRSFRKEVTLSNLLRMYEFEQMELEFFFDDDVDSYQKWIEYWIVETMNFFSSLGIEKEYLSISRLIEKKFLAHYSKTTSDIEFQFPRGKKEICGINYRSDYDLRGHIKKSGAKGGYFDRKVNRLVIPHVIEASFGVDRIFFALICSAYRREKIKGENERIVLNLQRNISPYFIAIFPWGKPQRGQAKEIYFFLKRNGVCSTYDENGSIGKRYRRQDEIGTPFCLTIDSDTSSVDYFIVRERESMKQICIKKDELLSFVKKESKK